MQKKLIDDSNLGRKKCPKKKTGRNPKGLKNFIKQYEVDLKLIVSFMERTLVETLLEIRKNLCYFSSVYL